MHDTSGAPFWKEPVVAIELDEKKPVTFSPSASRQIPFVLTVTDWLCVGLCSSVYAKAMTQQDAAASLTAKPTISAAGGEVDGLALGSVQSSPSNAVGWSGQGKAERRG
jgi:hypothetical protein